MSNSARSIQPSSSSSQRRKIFCLVAFRPDHGPDDSLTRSEGHQTYSDKASTSSPDKASLPSASSSLNLFSAWEDIALKLWSVPASAAFEVPSGRFRCRSGPRLQGGVQHKLTRDEKLKEGQLKLGAVPHGSRDEDPSHHLQRHPEDPVVGEKLGELFDADRSLHSPWPSRQRLPRILPPPDMVRGGAPDIREYFLNRCRTDLASGASLPGGSDSCMHQPRFEVLSRPSC
jgi:hypothetical protein